jgi:hypothetical protein
LFPDEDAMRGGGGKINPDSDDEEAEGKERDLT